MTAFSPSASWLLLGWCLIASVYLAVVIAGNAKHTPHHRRGPRTASPTASESDHSRRTVQPSRRYAGGGRTSLWNGSK